MRAIMVSVDYSDLLSVTLPYNIHHFSKICIVTSHADAHNVGRVVASVDQYSKVVLFITDAFYNDGATFNKWKSLELALDWYGREGWICNMDADVVWPRDLRSVVDGDRLTFNDKNNVSTTYVKGQLISPLRRMYPVLPKTLDDVPAESEWSRYSIHRNVAEWAGFSQIFHGDDPVLGQPPWHQTGFTHAGIADSLFQQRWSPQNKVRPTWDCLHFGSAGLNWYGRATKYADGSTPENADVKLKQCTDIWTGRRALEAKGEDRFKHERIVK